MHLARLVYENDRKLRNTSATSASSASSPKFYESTTAGNRDTDDPSIFHALIVEARVYSYTCANT